MKENYSLDSNIKKYASIAGSITAAIGTASSQVNYTDLNPDVLITGDWSTYSMDLNGDSIIDFTFFTIDQSIPSYGLTDIKAAFVYPGVGNSWAGFSTSSYGSSYLFLSNIPQGSTIGPSNSWSYSSSGDLGRVVNMTSSNGEFLGITGFVGLKFNAGGNTHYGWARVEVGSGGEFLSIKDYAYDATPNTAIPAGETGSGPVVIENIESNVEILNLNDKLRIQMGSELTNSIATITSITGQEILNHAINNTIELIDLNDISSGIYMVTVNTDQGMFNKKIYIR
jgi:hypothetical protein